VFQKITRNIKENLAETSPYLFTLLKKCADATEINFNAVLGRHFLLHPRVKINIETSGICNLKCCFCAYPKKELAKVVMPMELFQEVVEQAAEMGFSTIGLTPLTGDVFMDKGLFEKMHYLDRHPKIKKYQFFTNFVIPSESQIEELFKLRKLKMMHVSLYGHDEKSFTDLTKGTAKEYQRLVRNLKHLYTLYSQDHPFQLKMNWRTVLNFAKNSSPSELQKIVGDFEKKHHLKVQNVLLFNNWGGLITNEDVKEVGLTVNEGRQIYRNAHFSIRRGACGWGPVYVAMLTVLSSWAT